MSSKVGLFIDPALDTGLAVVDYGSNEVLHLQSCSLHGLTVAGQYYALQELVCILIGIWNIDTVVVEHIKAIYQGNNISNFQLNVIYQVALATMPKRKDVKLYLITNPTIRSHLLKYARTFDHNAKNTSLSKAKIRDLMCNFFNLDKKKDIRSNYNLSDALAVAYTYGIYKNNEDLMKTLKEFK